jgi:sigma-B regulation protein RsbU (phosphoserine phosphatase)
LFSTFADVKITVTDVLVDGPRIALLSTIETTDRAGWFGLPPTGGPIAYRLVLLLTIGEGRIVRDERIYDSAGVVERLEKARLDKELQTAADVQRSLLSRTVHRAAFCESIGDSVPCRAIGGDFFEFLDLAPDRVAIAMGDIAGKGPAAALLAALVQGMLVVEAPLADGPAATLERLNRRLVARCPEGRFATLVYAVLSADGRLEYSNAGHNPPGLVTDAGVARLGAGGPILGAFPNAEFEQQTVRVGPGATLMMFTDGVTEAQNADGEEYGDARLMASLHDHAADAPAALLRGVFASLRAFCGDAEQSDDLTVTVTRLSGDVRT